MFQRILVAVDRNSEMAQHVLVEALAVAQANQAQVNIVQVLYPLKNTYPDPMYAPLSGALNTINIPDLELYLENWENLREQSQADLEGYVAQARELGLEAAATQMMGDAGREICRCAETWNADLIVIGRRGVRGLEKLLLGSVSSYVMHRAHCAVLVVQGE